MNVRAATGSVLALLATLLLSTPAHAQIFRAYLAPTGSDANGCTLVAPCRLLPAALAAVADGGEIWLLDSANYNTATVSISKSVSIVAVPGALGSFVALSGGPALSIATPGIKVSLRGVSVVSLAGAAPGSFGVVMNAASSLIVDRCLFAGLPQGAIHIDGAGTVQVTDTVIRNINDVALRLENGARAAISSTKILDSTHGIMASSIAPGTLTQVTVSDSVVSGVSMGILASASNASAVVRVTVTRSTIERAAWGVSAEAFDGTATLSVSGSTIAHSSNGWYVTGPGAQVRSYGNNQWVANTSNEGTLTNATMQ